MAVHARLLGPAKDLNRVRTSRHGSVRARARGFLFKANNGDLVQIALDDWSDVAELAAALLEQIPENPHCFTAHYLQDWAKKQR